MKVGYFPGCSLHATAREFDMSLKALTGPLGFELEEIKDWACCGATSAHATNHLLSVALPARTLALAEEQGHREVMAPCAACYSRLATARHELKKDAQLAERVDQVLERSFKNSVQVSNVVGLLKALTPVLKEKAVKPLKDMKVACYYGCLLVRPPEVVDFDDPEAPTSMEEVMKAAGATPVTWNRRLDCCGGGFSLARTDSVIRLGQAILEDAEAAGAQAVVVACPMCHSNLDLRQLAIAQRRGKAMELPILFITQVVGLALGLSPKALGLDRHFVTTAAVAGQGANQAHGEVG